MWQVERHMQDYGIQVPRGRLTEHRLVSVAVVQYGWVPSLTTVFRLLLAVGGITCIAVWPGWSSNELPWMFKLIVLFACAGWVLMFARSLRQWRQIKRQWIVPQEWHDVPESVLMEAAEAGARVQSLESRLWTLKCGRHFTGIEAVALQRPERTPALRRSLEDQLERAREDLIVAVATSRLELEDSEALSWRLE